MNCLVINWIPLVINWYLCNNIHQDLPKEILDARKPLWAKLKSIKEQDSEAKVNIVFPAKLIKNGHIIADSFPGWNIVMKKSRVIPKLVINDPQHSMASEQPPPENLSVPDFNPTPETLTLLVMETGHYDIAEKSQHDVLGMGSLHQSTQSKCEIAVASFDAARIASTGEEETGPPGNST